MFFPQVINVLEEGEEYCLSYMESGPGRTYKWPSRIDLSQEPRKHILHSLPAPTLIEHLSSSRQQYFSFDVWNLFQTYLNCIISQVLTEHAKPWYRL